MAKGYVFLIPVARDLHYLCCLAKHPPGNMLRITVLEDQKVHTIRLEGKVVGPWAHELECVWTALAPVLGSKKLQLDLRGDTFADHKARQLLREIYQKTHAGFLADSPLTKYFADDARQQSTNEMQGGE